jgi:hypothetical protein
MDDYIGAIQIGVVVLAVWWLISSIAIGLAAEKRGRGLGAWFWISIFLGPILAALLLLAYPIVETDEADNAIPQ